MLESSDSDFWEHLDDQLVLGKKSSPKPLEPAKPESPKPEIKKKPLYWDFDKQKLLTERIITAGLQKAAEEGIRIKNQTKKEFYPIIQENLYTFRKDITQMIDQHQYFKEKLYETTNYLHDIEQTLKVQCKAASKMDFFLNHSKSIQSPQKNKENPLIQDLKSMTAQVSCLREVTAEYSRDAEKAAEIVEKVKKEIAFLNETHKSRISKLKNFYSQQETAVHEETDRIKKQYARYRIHAELELELREIIKKRQTDFMGKLYTELGNTKFIIQNPRLRMQFHRKVNKGTVERENGESGKRDEMVSRGTKGSDGKESFSLAQTRPVTNDLRIGNRKGEEDDVFAMRVMTRLRNASTPFR